MMFVYNDAGASRNDIIKNSEVIGEEWGNCYVQWRRSVSPHMRSENTV